ncbi:unnamed protein product [Paramecium pentaurelia]|uniref:Uncharacterized protein n=1 Tax=Paramecium pentaurelia TaxID=43138 RepID=A0A8S1SZD2_9CILI|nr:unnamed protein product [Paramecium pentaurelia]
MINMIGFLLLVIETQTITLELNQFYECSCEHLLTAQDCLITFCNWNNNEEKCSNKSCNEFNQGDCQGVPDSFGCIWNYNSNECQNFKNCSDYSFPITQASNCYGLIKCQANIDSIDQTADTVKCMDKSNDSARSIAKCDQIPYRDCEWLVTDDNKKCVRNIQTQTCETKTINQCSDYKTLDECDMNTCYWNDSCNSLDCSKLSEKNCQFYFSFDSKNITLCTWKDNQCVELEPETLQQNQCLSYTIYSYAWNPDSESCEVCQKSNLQEFIFCRLILLALVLN